VDYPQNAEDKLMCYSQEALEPETIRGQACLLIAGRQAGTCPRVMACRLWCQLNIFPEHQY